MPRGYLALVVELHHPMPGPGQDVGHDWAAACAETYWPILRALAAAADSGLSEVLTLAVSPAWIALASDPLGQYLTRLELDRRANSDGGRRGNAFWNELRQFVLDRWNGNPLAALRRCLDSGAVEVIGSTASHAWLPSLVHHAVTARAQVALAISDFAFHFASKPQGIWLPHRAYRPEFERTIARSGARYFGVDADAFRRGTIRSPLDIYGPLVTSAGVAAFAIDPNPTSELRELSSSFQRDLRNSDSATAVGAAHSHASGWVASWKHRIETAVRKRNRVVPIGVVALPTEMLGGDGTVGACWLERVIFELSASPDWLATTPGRYLDRYPEHALGRPGPSAGGWSSVRPHGSDLLDRLLVSADLLADLVAQPSRLGHLEQRALAQLTRSFLLAQSFDWHLPPGLGISAEHGLARADRRLSEFAELAGLISAGRVDPRRLSELEAGPAYLPAIDLEQLAVD
jgi:1,4-alpha-glucan branching enzyme